MNEVKFKIVRINTLTIFFYILNVEQSEKRDLLFFYFNYFSILGAILPPYNRG